METKMNHHNHISQNYGPLGSLVGEKYVVGSECYSILQQFLGRLLMEDKTLRTFRRSFDFSQTIQKDLIPLLIYVKDKKNVTHITVKILANLTTPVDFLLPIDVMKKTDAGRNVVCELSWLLFSCIQAFLEPKSTRKIIDNIRDVIEKGEQMNEEDYELLNDSMILLRNILYLPEMKPSESLTSSKNQIIWNLFAQNMDKVLIQLMTSGHEGEWTLALVQVVSLLYKDQNAVAFGKLLSMRVEASFLSESSDNESNTERRSDDLAPSDYSDMSGSEEEFPNYSLTKKGSCPRKASKQSNQAVRNEDSGKGSLSPEISDCGYVTQLETQESVSPSSNDDDAPNSFKPMHQKPGNMIHRSRFKDGKPSLTLQEKEDLKRKKLMKRSRTNVMNMKALFHHTPTDEDISQLLKEFTIDFLLKGYNSLLCGLCDLLLQTRVHVFFDISHFFWLVTYFLKFAVQLELDLEHISSVLSYKIVSFLTFEGVELCEQIENANIDSDYDMTPFLKRIHMVVNAIREFIQTINSYEKVENLNEKNKMHLLKLQRKICETKELRCLFVLLLRQFNPRLHSIQYLQDVIVTNHMLLSFIDCGFLPNTNAILQIHLRQFVAVDIIGQYGRILETFQQNGEFLNDCVFTMMHHVAGDLESVSALFQPKILKAFSQIWETDFELCDDWNDLVHYVIYKFLNISGPIAVVQEKKDNTSKPVLTIQEWSKKDHDSLFWFYVQCAKGKDPVGDVVKLYSDEGVEQKTRIGVIEQLLKQDIINSKQYNKLMEKEHITVTGIRSKIYPTKIDEIKLLTENLKRDNKFGFVIWVQKVLLEACHAKLSRNLKSKQMIEPVPYHCSLLQEPFPLITWSGEQCSIMQSQVFLLLLHKLGLVLPSKTGKIFARIPHSWSPTTMYEIAEKLGPLQSDWIKFDVSMLVRTEPNLKQNLCTLPDTSDTPMQI